MTDGETFFTEQGAVVPALSEAEMREVDRLAVEDLQLSLLQMMENAGRSLALQAMELVGGARASIVILAGPGGNGGGGICAARHLHNHGYDVRLALSKAPEELRGAAGLQYAILAAAGFQAASPEQIERSLAEADLVIDALIGYSLKGPPQGRAADLISQCEKGDAPILALDLPSGMDATTGERPGVAIHPAHTMTLALPKRGLTKAEGELSLADIGIPPQLYKRLGLIVPELFGMRYIIRLFTEEPHR